MDFTNYKKIFEAASSELNAELPTTSPLQCKAGIWLSSIVLKVQAPSWINDSAKMFESGIFFSVWMGEEDICKKRLFYNIHALKLRHLKNYSIESRKFAKMFREKFIDLKKPWPNVSLDHGPLTLMEGWIPLNEGNLQEDLVKLSRKFFKIAPVIDDVLLNFKKNK